MLLCITVDHCMIVWLSHVPLLRVGLNMFILGVLLPCRCRLWNAGCLCPSNFKTLWDQINLSGQSGCLGCRGIWGFEDQVQTTWQHILYPCSMSTKNCLMKKHPAASLSRLPAMAFGAKIFLPPQPIISWPTASLSSGRVSGAGGFDRDHPDVSCVFFCRAQTSARTCLALRPAARHTSRLSGARVQHAATKPHEGIIRNVLHRRCRA